MFTLTKLKMWENIMIEYNFRPVLYMNMLEIFNGDQDEGWILGKLNDGY